jgi:P27 family predicted phage terminase small subunit
MSRSSRSSKVASGNYRPDRMRTGRGLEPLQRLPIAPNGLSEPAKTAWRDAGRRAIALGTLTESDIPLLELLSRTLGSVAELEKNLARDGVLIDTGLVKKANPALQAVDRARALAHRLLGEFGLTPTSRERISIDPDHGKPNPFSEFSTWPDASPDRDRPDKRIVK